MYDNYDIIIIFGASLKREAVNKTNVIVVYISPGEDSSSRDNERLFREREEEYPD